LSAAIDKYIYTSLHETFLDELIVRYSQTERVSSLEQIKHPLVREAFKLAGISELNLEVTSIADLPAGTGLGSSGAFIVSLLSVLYWQQKLPMERIALAEKACHVEIDLLKEPVGKQDQYIATFGGVTCFDIESSGSVCVHALNADPGTVERLEQNLSLFFTGYSRSAYSILREQDDKSRDLDGAMIENLHRVKELGLKIKSLLEKGDLSEFAALLNEHWHHKKQRSSSMSNEQIDQWYEKGMRNGALGGKLIGAGGGGFLLFYSEERERLSEAMKDDGLREVPFKFDFEGTKFVV
jgi:D-glycero-alpha-D-manno-heptose-7-phosphate kinase